MEIISKNKCNGCSACTGICPLNCIEMVPDELGFLYPEINAEICTECGLCKETCSGLKPKTEKAANEAYAVSGVDNKIRETSSSGGVFYLIAKNVLGNGGVVFGAAFENGFYKVKHIAVSESEELIKLQGSKYIQSEIGDSYISAKAFLEQGKTVLFSGTPCQISGLKAFLNKEYQNLYLLEIACHGVPSPAVWEKYLKYIENKHKSRAKSVNFRDKQKGWRNYLLKIKMNNEKVYSNSREKDLYMRGFLHNVFLRPSCFECEHKIKNTEADITLADFWGVEKISANFKDDKGVSLVIISSSKGKHLLEPIKQEIKAEKVLADKAIEENSAIVFSANRNPASEKFKKDFINKPIYKALKKHCCLSIIKKIKKKIKLLLKR